MTKSRLIDPMRGLVVACLCGAPFATAPARGQSCDDTAFGVGTTLSLAPVQLEIGDVNGDGKLDIISVENGSVQVAFGNGDGTFLAPASTPGPASPTASAIGEFNGDGRIDLVVGSGSTVSVFLGSSTGFTAASSYAAGATVRGLATADFNRDGRVDALAAATTVDVYVLPGNGDGTFGSPQGTALGAADIILVGDFNGDLAPDLALFRQISNDVAISLNDGSGTFLPLLMPPNSFPAAAQDLVLDDFDRDGRLDLAEVSRSPGKALYVRLGNGDGTFPPGPAIQTNLVTNLPQFLVVGNFDGNPLPDVAVTVQGSQDYEVLLGAGDGTFVTLGAQSLGGGSPGGVAAGDLNGDGLDDLVLIFNGVQVLLNETGIPCASHLTATSTGGAAPTSGQNVLQWQNPSGTGFTGIRIRYDTASTAAGCTPPASATGGSASTIDLAFAAGRQTYAHGGLNLNLFYCYSAFVKRGASTYSPPRNVTARPFDSTLTVKWAFATGAASMAPPGNGLGAIHVVANDNVLYSVLKGASGGTWPGNPPTTPLWTPRAMAGPSQGRPSTVGIPLGTAAQVVFLGSQDGHVYAIDAQRGTLVWRSPLLGTNVQATPSGMFTAFGGAHDYILVGTRVAGLANRFYFLRMSDGSVAWTFDGQGHRIGVVNSQASVDYPGRRVYFASFAFGAAAPDNDTVWCVDLDTGNRIWSAAVGDVLGSPIVRGNRLYVGTYTSAGGGRIHALNTLDGSPAWTAPFDTGFDGPVKSFVAPDRQNHRLLFSTTNKIWALDDPLVSTTPPSVPVWVRDATTEPVATRIPSPSTPLFLAGGPHIYVGSGDGAVYRLDYATGNTLLKVPLGDQTVPAPVGSPTLDLNAGFLYVGTAGGAVYAVQIP